MMKEPGALLVGGPLLPHTLHPCNISTIIPPGERHPHLFTLSQVSVSSFRPASPGLDPVHHLTELSPDLMLEAAAYTSSAPA